MLKNTRADLAFRKSPVSLCLGILLAVSACKGAEISSSPQGGGTGQSSAGKGAGGNSGGSTTSGAGGIDLRPSNADGGFTPTGKGCGNSALDESQGETCDDGNKTNGDGCSAICQTEANWYCPEPGKPCQNLAVCGNGLLTSDEVCDDHNTDNGDGCSSDCQTIEPGWQCRVPGKPCTPSCGDGVISGTETCDDKNTKSGDGCSATCKLEVGFKCSGSPSDCMRTKCGDGKVEGGEGCDKGDLVPFDGCSADCQIEPDCSGTSCTSKCGDGIVLGEECDDGNAASGDGCSKDCKKEPGWDCTQPDIGDKMMVPVIYRDFKFKNPTDFQSGVSGSYNPLTGIVKDTLDAKGKPVYSGNPWDS
jgi:cysteine-rich repeat protein